MEFVNITNNCISKCYACGKIIPIPLEIFTVLFLRSFLFCFKPWGGGLKSQHTVHQCSVNSLWIDSSEIYLLIFRWQIGSYSFWPHVHFMNIIHICQYYNLTNIIPICKYLLKYSCISYPNLSHYGTVSFSNKKNM